VLIYIVILFNLQKSNLWTWTYEWESRCIYPPLPANQSGAKVVVAGFAKTGTWAMTKNLNLIYNRTYHSEEFMVHVWDHLATEYWMRPENGGRRPPINHLLFTEYYANKEFRRTGRRPIPDMVLATESTMKGGDAGENLTLPPDDERFPNDDLKVVADLKHETLAAHMSRCRVDSIAFDGLDGIFWHVYDVSPGAKVILLDWRSYQSWRESLARFATKFLLLTLATNVMYSSLHGLPWGFLVRQFDRATGGRVDEMLRTGGVFLVKEYDAPFQLWCTLTFQRTVVSHWWGGLQRVVLSKAEYDGFFQEVARRTPPENLLRWNFKKNTWEDLCRFLSVQDCPDSGLLEHANNVNAWDKFPWEETTEPMMLAPVFLFCHWVNWRVYMAIITAIAAIVMAPCRLVWSLCCRVKGD